MRCLYRCFLPRVKGRMCDSGKVLVWKNITSVCWKLALLAPWRWGSASWQRKRDDWYIGIISEGPWMWRQVAYVWCRLAGEGSRGMGREGWHSQSSGLGKSPFMGMFWKRIQAGQGCVRQSCGERRFVDHDSTVTRLWPARARLCFWEVLWARSSSKVKAGAEE